MPLSALRTKLSTVDRHRNSTPEQGLQHYLDLPVSRARCPSPPKELDLAAFQDDLCFAHMFSNFVWRAYGNSWLSDAAGSKVGSLSFDASRAMAQAHFGRANKQIRIEITGQKQYGKCLSSLATELSGDECVSRNSRHHLIIPILVLLMHAVGSRKHSRL